MARFISKHQRYSLGLKPEIALITAQGVPVVTEHLLLADFSHGGITEWELEEALKTFEFHGLPDGINPALRLSVYDTEFAAKEGRWSDELKAEVEDILRTSGRLGSDYIEVGRPTLPPPWPTYDDASIAKVLNRVIEDGYAPTEVLAYEMESQNRPEYIDALQRLVVDTMVPDDNTDLIPA